MPSQRNVLIFDSQSSFREALAYVLDHSGAFRAVQESAGYDPFQIERGSADVALIGMNTPLESPIACIPSLRRLHPSVAVVALVDHLASDASALALEAGANALLARDSPLDVLIAAMVTVQSDSLAVEPHLMHRYLSRSLQIRRKSFEEARLRSLLTRRELEILSHLARGLGDRDIAQQLSISVDTVRTHFARILEKLGVHTRIQALLLCLDHGLVEIDITVRPAKVARK
jgi:DNA-binding NarL/FixJ family response regulator